MESHRNQKMKRNANFHKTTSNTENLKLERHPHDRSSPTMASSCFSTIVCRVITPDLSDKSSRTAKRCVISAYVVWGACRKPYPACSQMQLLLTRFFHLPSPDIAVAHCRHWRWLALAWVGGWGPGSLLGPIGGSRLEHCSLHVCNKFKWLRHQQLRQHVGRRLKTRRQYN